ncbi:hypothetical protein FEM03_23465 [Phragmitibacter flavus]|uniref:Uncharacterized protein n=1 Tax=Phragmitibacter flavus TaxID=2576071 RepID=A0A5R8K7D8_9BACT|nr:hypothetical protein [Phragmitibacter flavus]TLD68281.1 hypothetical protein FEM03_23465 [Phragmitibacter flavus]
MEIILACCEPLGIWFKFLDDHFGEILAAFFAVLVGLFSIFPELVRRAILPIAIDVEWHNRNPYLSLHSTFDLLEEKRQHTLKTISTSEHDAAWLRLEVKNLSAREAEKVELIIDYFEKRDACGWSPHKHFIQIALSPTHCAGAELPRIAPKTSHFWNFAMWNEKTIDPKHGNAEDPICYALTIPSHKGSIMKSGEYRFRLRVIGVGGLMHESRWKFSFKTDEVKSLEGFFVPNLSLERMGVPTRSRQTRWILGA